MAKKTKILICTHKSCHRKGAKEVFQCLEDEIESRGLEKSICAKKSDCLGMCGKGPAIKIKSEKVAFSKVSAEDCLDIINALIKDKPLKDLKIKR